jgi:hypothetical protein
MYFLKLPGESIRVISFKMGEVVWDPWNFVRKSLPNFDNAEKGLSANVTFQFYYQIELRGHFLV